MSAPRYDEDSDYGSDEEGEVSTVHLGLADGPLEGDDESNPLVSRIGGRPAWLPLAANNLPPASLIECSQCKQPMELLVQIFAPLEDSPYDRNLLVWGCALAECQRKAQGRLTNSVRVIRMLKYNARWAAKLEKQRKKQEAREARLAERKKREAEAEAEKARRERATNPFSMSSTTTGNSLFGSGSLFSSAPQPPDADKKENSSAQHTPSETNEADEADDDSESEYDEEERLAEELAIKASLEQQREQLGSENDWAATAPCYTPALYLNTIPEPSRTSEKLEPPSTATLERAAESGADMDQGDEEEYERMRVEGIDEVFERFTERLGSEARQVVRYEFDGVPLPFTGLGSVYRQLWPANKYDGSKVPPCPHCGAPRVFEVQLMPNLANLLRAEQLKHRASLATSADDEMRRRAEIASTLGIEVEKAGDGSALPTGIVWSTAMVFVCSKDCSQHDGEGWAEEWAAVQFEQEI